jgi:hypothetical protein
LSKIVVVTAPSGRSPRTNRKVAVLGRKGCKRRDAVRAAVPISIDHD